MSEANLSHMRYVSEVTPGVTPNSPNFKELLFVSSSFVRKPTHVQDDSITDDRGIAASSQVSYETNGDIVHNLRYGVLDELFESAFMGDWTNTATDVGTAIVATSGVITVSIGTNFPVSSLVQVQNFVNPANNGVRAVSANGATSITIGATGGTDESGTASVKLVGLQGVAGDITATASGLGSTTLDFTTFPLTIGHWVYVGSSTTTHAFGVCPSGWGRISGIAAHALTFDTFPTGWTTDAGTGKTIRMFIGDVLRTAKSYHAKTFERQMTRDDNTAMYRYFRGMQMSVKFEITTKGLIKTTFSCMGMSTSVISTTRFTGATTTLLSSDEDTDVFDGANNVSQVFVNKVALTNPNIPLSFDVTVDNAYRTRMSLGLRGPAAVKAGSINCTGTLESYLGDASLQALLDNDQYFPLGIPMVTKLKDQGYFLDLPNLKFTDGGEDITGKDTDIVPKMPFLAHRTSGAVRYTAQLQRYPYLELV